jgi:hypothetical protein
MDASCMFDLLSKMGQACRFTIYKPRPPDIKMSDESSTICTAEQLGWVKQTEAIKEGFNKYGPKRRNMRARKFEELEEVVIRWFREFVISCLLSQNYTTAVKIAM